LRESRELITVIIVIISPFQEIRRMGRLVRLPREASRTLDPAAAGARDGRGTAGDSAPSLAVDPDDYLQRLAKYVPAEIVAFSILINAILEQALRDGGPAAAMAGIPVMTIAIAALVAGTIMSPFFVWYVRQKGDAWITHAGVAFLAFPVWSYALDAVAFADHRDGNLAAIVLATFTLLSGLVKPLPFEVARAQAAAGTREIAPRRTGSAAVAARRLAEVISIPLPGP
jgi:hypothetical protein